MTILTNVIKALEALKSSQFSSSVLSESGMSKKDKISNCTTIVEGMSSSSAKSNTKFLEILSSSIEALLNLCNDSDSDVRMVADECLNKLIRAMIDINIVKVQMELYHEIKKNGPARTLRAALWRFALLSHLIRPLKRKPYISNLIPCIVSIAGRSEDSVIETLSQSLPLLLKPLGSFMSDNDIKTLLRAFFKAIPSPEAVFRRAAANMIVTTCLNCRKTQVSLYYTLNYVLDMLAHTNEKDQSTTIIGVFGCIKAIIPHLDPQDTDIQKLECSLRIYELCLHYSKHHSNHNVVNAVLETLAQLLHYPTQSFINSFLSEDGINAHRNLFDDSSVISLDQMSNFNITTTSENVSNSTLTLNDSEIPEIVTNIKKWGSDSAMVSITDSPRTSSANSSREIHQEDEDSNEFMDIKSDDYSGLTIGIIDKECTEDESENVILVEKSEKPAQIQTLIEQSRDESLNQSLASTISVHNTNLDYSEYNIDIGNYTDQDMPIKYCCRYLVSTFLLAGSPGHLMSEKSFRVSVKSLALTCVGHMLRLYPNLLLISLAKTNDADKDQQMIFDITLFANHSDPQIRGNVSIVIGYFLRSLFVRYRGSFNEFSSCTFSNETENFKLLDKMIKLLSMGLEDDSAVTCRLTLDALNHCLPSLLESTDHSYGIPLLNILPQLVKNPYFLVKIKLVELLSILEYTTIEYILGDSSFQAKSIDIILTLLGDQDQRVRRAACDAIIKFIPLLYFNHPREDAVTNKAAGCIGILLKLITSSTAELFGYQDKHKLVINTSIEPFTFLNTHNNIETTVEDSLSRIVNKLTEILLVHSSHYLTFGCCEALSRLSEMYATTMYSRAWNCILSKTTQKKTSKKNNSRTEVNDIYVTNEIISTPVGSGLLSLTLSFLIASPVSLDLATHRHLILLAGNLISSLTVHNWKPNDPNKTDTDTSNFWGVLKDKQLYHQLELLLTHIVRVLNIYTHVSIEAHIVQPSKSVLPSVPVNQSLSPRKRMGFEPKNRERSDKGMLLKMKKEHIGVFSTIPHYTKLYEICKAAHSNYLATLEPEASEMYLSLLNAALDVLSQILEVATMNEAAKIAEEVLYYLQYAVILSPISSVRCVQQLLKCLFGTNLSAQWNDFNLYKLMKNNISRDDDKGFYDRCLQKAAREMADAIKAIGDNCQGSNEPDTGWIGFLRRKGDRKLSSVLKNFVYYGDQKMSVASFISLFEPMVIKSLRMYTVTSSIELQCQVLILLSQLIRLKINYCMLDAEQVFIGFVLNQFELIEEGFIQNTEKLLPRIFEFLIQLSYEKNHSKVIISVPKVIQLCDGLMASGQPPLTHCVPALIPVVKNIFLTCDTSLKPSEQRELETTREVLISMLLRLAEYHEILDLLAVCLIESRFSGDGSGEEKWRKWSRLATDGVLPLLAEGRIRLESPEAHIALVKLFSSFSPTVFRPVDPLLKVLFTPPVMLEESFTNLSRWLGMINVVLLFLISCAKEESMLARLSDLSIYMTDLPNLFSTTNTDSQETESDPLNVLNNQSLDVPSHYILAKFIFKVIKLLSFKILGLINEGSNTSSNVLLSSPDIENYLLQQFKFFLQLCIHMFESGSHCKVANAAMKMIQESKVEDESKLSICELNKVFLDIGKVCPMLTCQWAYLMTLLSYNDMSFWSKILGKNELRKISEIHSTEKVSINTQIISKSGTILFCDYVCENLNDAEPLTWLLVNYIEKTINLMTESPVKDLLAVAVHRNPAASGLLIQAIATKCTDISQPSFVKRLLHCIEGAHHSQSGAVILTLVPHFLTTKYLALSRMAAQIASRRVEILLALNAEDAIKQLPKEDLVKLMDSLQSKKLSKKYGSLVSLLNKLGTQYYDLSPLELEHSRPFNPSTVKNIQIDRNWYLSQVRFRCCYPNSIYSSFESAQLLSALNFDDCLSILSSKDFNLKILKECLKLGIRLSIEKCQATKFEKPLEKDLHFETNPLYAAAKQCLSIHLQHIIELLPKTHQIFDPAISNLHGKPLKYATRMIESLEDPAYWEILMMIVSAISTYLRTLSKLAKYNLIKHDVGFEIDMARFALLCLEVTHWMLYMDENNFKKLVPRDMEVLLSCANEILKQPGPSKHFGQSSRYSWVCSASTTLKKLFRYMSVRIDALPPTSIKPLETALGGEATCDYAQACIRMAELIAWLEKCQIENFSINIPRNLMTIIRDLIISISRQPLVNSYILMPPLVWKQGWQMTGSGETKCHFPLPSSESNHLQEVDILEQFVYRINLLGWTSRLQFEEIWMALLGVLNVSQNENTPREEVAALIQASCLAVQAITKLLQQTLLLPYPGNPNASSPIHLSRDPQLSVQKISSQKLYMIQDLLIWKYESINNFQCLDGQYLGHLFHRGNIEKVASMDKFTYSQLSVSFLWSMCNLYEDKLSASVLDLKNRRNDALVSASLDLDSCLRFLIELYSSWTSPQANTPVQLLTEVVKSILGISELFVERSQFQWMLDICLGISKTHPIENHILYQYLVVSVCKAAAVLTPLDIETMDKVKNLVDINLKSAILAARISALHGTLYLFESAALANCEETMNMIHPLAIEYIQKHINSQDINNILCQSEEHQGIMWALVFFLLEHAEDSPSDTDAPAVLELVLSLITSQSISATLHQTLLQGLERLVATKSVVGNVAEQIVKVAMDRLKQPSPMFALPALQLLLTCMYTESADRLNQPDMDEPLPDIEPDSLVRSIERTYAIFDRIKKGYPMEAEILCSTASEILRDFFPPSESLSKVIGEFLSPQQPHSRLLSGVVFKACERICMSADIGLLQDWVVFTVPSFIQSLPVAMSTWCLSCFFISASTNPWLRALFPHVQSRIGKFEYEDKKILCIVASDFYHKLSKESQKKAFIEKFEEAAGNCLFNDILAIF